MSPTTRQKTPLYLLSSSEFEIQLDRMISMLFLIFLASAEHQHEQQHDQHEHNNGHSTIEQIMVTLLMGQCLHIYIIELGHVAQTTNFLRK